MFHPHKDGASSLESGSEGFCLVRITRISNNENFITFPFFYFHIDYTNTSNV